MRPTGAAMSGDCRRSLRRSGQLFQVLLRVAPLSLTAERRCPFHAKGELCGDAASLLPARGATVFQRRIVPLDARGR
jgi:hypothetical protein